MRVNHIDLNVVRDLFTYDGESLRWKKKIKRRKAGSFVYGVINNKGYRQVKVGEKWLLVHRIIFLLCNKYLTPVVDHIDGNPKNNKIENLRGCDQIKNSQNSRIAKSNKTGVKGVSIHPQSGKFRADLTVNKKQRYLGVYDTLEKAKAVVNEARKIHHGEFARYE